MDRKLFDGRRQIGKLDIMEFWSLQVEVVGGAQKVGCKLERRSPMRPTSPHTVHVVSRNPRERASGIQGYFRVSTCC